MATYYDPIYGRIRIDDLVLDMVSKCSELKRLRFIGMMNFKSLTMLPLTTISRLEHSIGVAYLVQLLTENNPSLGTLYRDLLVASLYHDVNCGPFGHSVEWAIDRHIPFEHETDAKWVKTEETLSCLINKPIYLEQDGLHRHGFVEKHKLNFARIDQIINGNDYFYINNKGIDLDNIDNVFRMAHYLGILDETNMPQKLVRALRVSSSLDNFIISKSAISLIEKWYRLRATVYQKFIYSEEYMGYEYLIFELISEYARTLHEIEDVKNLFHYTDERLLWSCYDMKQSNPNIANLSKRLLLHDIPKCYGIIMSESVPIQNPLRDQQVRERLVDLIQSEVAKSGFNILLDLHMTTDDRKTNRRIEFYVEEVKKHSLVSIGEDRQYVLLAILGKRDIKPSISDRIINIAIEVLEKQGFPDFCAYENELFDSPQQSLF